MQTDTIGTLENEAAEDSESVDLPDPYDTDKYRYDSRSELTPEKVETVADVLRGSGTKQIAASKVNVTVRTLHNWMNRGEDNVTSDARLNGYGVFYLHADRALNQSKASLFSQVLEHVEDDWRAGKWALQVLYPGEFKDVSKHQVEHLAQTETEHEVTDEDRAFLKSMFGQDDDATVALDDCEDRGGDQ